MNVTTSSSQRPRGPGFAVLAVGLLLVAAGCSSGGGSGGTTGGAAAPSGGTSSSAGSESSASGGTTSESSGSSGSSASGGPSSESSAAGGSSNASESGPTSGTVSIGLATAWTGNAAFLGPELEKGMKVAIHDINGAGGTDGHQVKMAKSDTGGTTQGAISAVGKLLKADNVAGMVGPTSVTVMGVLDRIQASKIPSMILGSTAALDDTIKGDTTFRVTPSDTLQGPAMAQLAMNKGFKHCSIVTESLEGAQSVRKNVKTAYKALGGVIDRDITIAVKQPSYSSDILKLLNKPVPKCVFIEISPESGAQFWQDASQFDSVSKPLFIGTDTVVNSDSLKTLKPVQDKLNLDAVSPGGSGPGYQAYSKLYKKVYPNSQGPVDLSDLSYDSAVILALAMDEAQSVDPSTYVSHIRTVANDGTQCLTYSKCKSLLDKGKDINFDGAAGDDDIRANGNSISGYTVSQVKDGKVTQVGTVSKKDVTALVKKIQG